MMLNARTAMTLDLSLCEKPSQCPMSAQVRRQTTLRALSKCRATDAILSDAGRRKLNTNVKRAKMIQTFARQSPASGIARRLQTKSHKVRPSKMKKGAVGWFSYWLVGKMKWEISDDRTGETVATAENLSTAARLAERFNGGIKKQ
jgi:hypothetical protein